jgi:hypothetical protein
MMKQNGNRFATALILHSSFFLLHFPALAKGEIASLSGLRRAVVFDVSKFHASPLQSIIIVRPMASSTQAGRGG